MRALRDKLCGYLLGGKYRRLFGQVDALARKVQFLELVVQDPRKAWLYQNIDERMDANVAELFDEKRRRFHLARYEFAQPYTKDCNVLDLASGTGYGAALFAEHARSVVGIDIDAAAVAYANDVYGAANCRYQVASGDDTQMAGGSVDVVTSFETIEHVRSDDDLLSEFARVLRPGGTLVISTPNEWPLEIAEHHVREYDYDGFCAVLGKYFTVDEVHNQNSGSDSLYNHEQPAGITVTTPDNRHLAECYIAVCRKPLSSAGASQE